MKCRHKEMVGTASKCPKTYYPAEIIDLAVMSALKTQLFELELLKIKLSAPLFSETDPDRISRIERDIQVLQAEKTSAYESFAQGRLPKSEYLAKRDRIKKKIQKLEGKKTELFAPAGDKAEMCSEADRIVGLMEELNVGKEISQELIDGFIEKVYIHDMQHIEVVFKFDDLIERMTIEAGKEGEAS